ncbi:MAG TPA: PEP/pyruvate-binding domain-containing protein [Candidatus Limnocylindria bacterium]|nr:PEP/pyruvate-binding domain-containing protein [Candidatus Limnocylindria bacterium]
MSTAFLGDEASRDAQQVGAKAATLSRLADRFRVPAGFCLEASVFDRLGTALSGDRAALAALRALVSEGHSGLIARVGKPDPAVAVRSSAIGEDGAETSFAGQHETILDVRGLDAITAAVLECWRSAASERAVAYRAEHHITAPPRVGVLVQELVPAEAAAIAFSVDPVSGDRDTLVIDACLGLGEAIASGSVTPDTYAVRKRDVAIVKRTIAGGRPALDDGQVREVARLALALEAESGAPVDVECAFAEGSLHLLQARPITALPARSEFTVEWEDPADAALTWTREDVHMDECRPTLSAEFTLEAPAFGLDRANLVFGPPARVRYLTAHGYLYHARVPQAPSADMPALEATALTRRREWARHLGKDWTDRYRPAVLAHFAWMRTVRFDDRATALRAWDAFWPRVNDIWLIHMLIVPPVYSLLEELATLYAALTGRPATDAPTLAQGRQDTLHDLQQRLYDLATAIRARPAVARAIADARALDDLAAVEGGGEIRAAIEEFLAVHGDVGQTGFDIESASWSDEPRLLLVELARLVRAPGESPSVRRARLVADAEALEQRTRSELRDRPEDLARFTEVLTAAQACGALSEEHNYWIDRLCQAHARRFILRVAGVLVRAGLLGAPDDIFHLRIGEVRDALSSGADQRALVAERRRVFERDRRLRPPRAIGTPPAAPVAASAIRDLGYRVEQTERDVLRGVAASPGRGRGPARLVNGLADFERFQRGDVLVCRSTTVSWVPLFNMASGIVADLGGALSHAALVAREFGIPAVTGTGIALETLIDGELVEVDGTAGTVRRD